MLLNIFFILIQEKRFLDLKLSKALDFLKLSRMLCNAKHRQCDLNHYYIEWKKRPFEILPRDVPENQPAFLLHNE